MTEVAAAAGKRPAVAVMSLFIPTLSQILHLEHIQSGLIVGCGL